MLTNVNYAMTLLFWMALTRIWT